MIIDCYFVAGEGGKGGGGDQSSLNSTLKLLMSVSWRK